MISAEDRKSRGKQVGKKRESADGGKKGASKSTSKKRGISLVRRNTTVGQDPFDQVTWEQRTAAITGEGGQVFFEQKDVEVPTRWSQTAANVVVQKYFRGQPDTPERETSVRQLIGRVANTITKWGKKGKYFASDKDQETFRAELTHLLVQQKMAFNSPVWFNVGTEREPQCSACFINSVEDSMDSILTLAKTEGMLFKFGSGAGSNLSALRSSREFLNGGGTASGPVSFMRGFDSFAGAIKSGGKTRRAAKMVILNAEHPDIVEFVECKTAEEKKAWALIDAGYDGGFNVPGGAYDSISYQNANHSVRVTDEFMQAVVDDGEWNTKAITDGRVVDTYKARDLFRKISDAAHQCGDPGMQFDTIINAYHPCSNTERINASNPCSEYMFLDDSACNLASLNLIKFEQDGEFDVDAFKHAVELTILAQEILVDFAKYPTEKIRANSHRFRPLGLGFANLGALLMERGLPYDSDAARAYAAAITALMCGHAYGTSAKIAREATGPFAGYAENSEPFLNVMNKHRAHVDEIDSAFVPYELMTAAAEVWDEAIAVGSKHGFRNGQATVLAPTGTIGFMMDCDTTGIEPDIALVKYKRLVGGGMLKIVNHTVPRALAVLGYTAEEVKAIVDYIDEKETIEGARQLKAEHLAVFDCAFRSTSGTRTIHHMGHIKMMAAAQPFLSGAISKTVNLPSSCSVEDIEEAYMQAWRYGLKAIAVYRDGCKRTQPLSTGKTELMDPQARAEAERLRTNGPPLAVRKKLPDERHSVTHKFSVGGHDGYITVGLYQDGTPGEIFVRMAKEGSTLAGLLDAFATGVSLSLQHGVPLKLLCEKFRGTRFEPSGFTGNPDVPRATSVMDYIFRWIDLKFIQPRENMEVDQSQLDLPQVPVLPARTEATDAVVVEVASQGWVTESDAPPCHECGSIMVRSGACHKCINCGSTSGCS